MEKKLLTPYFPQITVENPSFTLDPLNVSFLLLISFINKTLFFQCSFSFGEVLSISVSNYVFVWITKDTLFKWVYDPDDFDSPSGGQLATLKFPPKKGDLRKVFINPSGSFAIVQTSRMTKCTVDLSEMKINCQYSTAWKVWQCFPSLTSFLLFSLNLFLVYHRVIMLFCSKTEH